MRSTVLFLLACQRVTAPGPPPAKLTLEGLATVTLRPDAEAALGIDVVPAARVAATATITVGGDVMVTAGRDVVLAAPVGGRISGALPKPGQSLRAGELLLSLVPLASVDRDVRARAQRELEVANAELTLADSRAARAEKMLADRSGSVKVAEEANAQKRVAQATVAAATSRLKTLDGGSLDADLSLAVRSPTDGVLRALRVTAGQSVPAGAPLLEIASSGRWVRASFPASDGTRLDTTHAATARRLGGGEPVVLTAIAGPPSADATRGTVDRFYALPADWTPGERVLVTVTVGAAAQALAVPVSAVIHDAEGGAWIYERKAPQVYRRRRVDPMRTEGDLMLLRTGPSEGALVVRAGAAELWGFELGADK